MKFLTELGNALPFKFLVTQLQLLSKRVRGLRVRIGQARLS